MEKKEEVRKVPIKNYVILGVIFGLVILLIWYLSTWYKAYDDYQKETPVIRGTLAEITNLELDHYVLENPTTTIYMCTSSKVECRNFEKDFKKVLNKDNKLKESIIYLNLSNIDQSVFVDEFNNKYNYKTKLNTNYPAIVLFEDAKVVGLLQAKKDSKLNINDVKSYLKLHKVS